MMATDSVEREIAGHFADWWSESRADTFDFDNAEHIQVLYAWVHKEAPEFGVDAVEDEIEVPVVGDHLRRLWRAHRWLIEAQTWRAQADSMAEVLQILNATPLEAELKAAIQDALDAYNLRRVRNRKEK